MSLTKNLLEEHKNKISEIALVPSSGGVFDVYLEEKQGCGCGHSKAEPTLIYSKKQVGRKPNPGEVEEMLRKVL
ncbi:MAG: Rdx family protein [Bacillota bacterium]|nr:Rdx family protein [Bacillota bacterium]